ncbi:phosphatase PAP2 family protein [Tahibacter amnicola]|uniref:undecaprenyl-diphosphate phosphatase n=1 Tax=Tahibacter amnicola TaxID=2976241 RepID=A0ABY6BIA3_9GAMM|nr:phosphatase PAP2 family protein [Tahibacter amnicola]UXI69570.1 phosphatase PAP2 family protein [Tahibacter amnicola]
MNALERWNHLEIRSGEWRLCLAANRWGSRDSIARFFGLISRAGDGAIWYVTMALFAAFGGSRGLQAALHMAATSLAALLLYRTLKRKTRRPRPFRAHEGIIARVPPLDEFSFPSGHTLHAVTFTLIACAYFPGTAGVLLPFTLLVATSRVVLGLHFPSDVLAAAIIGTVLASLSLWLIPGVSLFA